MAKIKIDTDRKLIVDAQHEVMKFEMNEPYYMLKNVLPLLPEDSFVTLRKLEKTYPNSKIMNIGGIPTLMIKRK